MQPWETGRSREISPLPLHTARVRCTCDVKSSLAFASSTSMQWSRVLDALHIAKSGPCGLGAPDSDWRILQIILRLVHIRTIREPERLPRYNRTDTTTVLRGRTRLKMWLHTDSVHVKPDPGRVDVLSSPLRRAR